MSKDSQSDRLLARMLEWWKGVPQFKHRHAVDSVYLARGYLEWQGTPDEDAAFWLAVSHCVWWWLDERSEHSAAEAGPLDWTALVAEVEGAEPGRAQAPPATTDAQVLRRVIEGMAGQARAEVDFTWWRTTISKTIQAFQKTEVLVQSETSFVEYLDLALWNSSIRNLLASTSLLCDLQLATRRSEPRVLALESALCLDARLENDLRSVDNERRLGTQANAVLLMERVLPPPAALAFIQEQHAGCRRLLKVSQDALGPDDPLVRLITAMFKTHHQWYETRPSRYQASPPAQ